jgi:hypothetical protein
MSMEVHYKHISSWLLELFAQKPALVEPFTVISLSRSLAPGDPDPSKMKRTKESDALDGMDEDMKEVIKSISAKYAPKILEEAKSHGYTLYKYFENVQFHITGEITDHGTTLLSQAVTGGQNIGPDVWPFGAATFLCGIDVEKVAKMLSKISDHQFLTRYSPAEWQWDKQTTEYALDYFKGFVSYYAEAAKAGHAMLVWGA